MFELPAAPEPTHSNDANDQESPVEPKTEHKQPDVAVAKEEYTVFTINQKRAMIVAASLCGWFRYEDQPQGIVKIRAHAL